MNYRTTIILIASLLFLSACSEPLPPNRLSYAGEWQSKEMALLILEDGTVAYQRVKGGGSTSINGPLKEFVGDDFVVGVGFLATTFQVSEPPHEADGVWQMVVDGVRLTRVDE